MSSVVKFWILGGTVVLIGVLFFHLVEPLVLPLFMGAVLAILFRPVFIWSTQLCHGRMRLAALVSTAAVVVTVVGPLVLVGKVAVEQASIFVRGILPRTLAARPRGPSDESPLTSAMESDEPPIDPASTVAADGGDTQGENRGTGRLTNLFQTAAAQRLLAKLEPYGVTESDLRTAAGKVANWIGGQLGPKAFDLVGLATRVVIDTFLLIVSLYFYFGDGPRILHTLDELTPLPPGRAAELFWEFENVCRAVVVAMFATSLLNGVLAGIGFWIAGVPHFLVLSIITVVMSFIPFVGLASVWASVTLYLSLQGHTGLAVFIALWCGGFINTLDHFVKPYIIGGQAKLHPLLVFVSVFGGIHLLGILGIFVGPIIGAVLYALLKILRAELSRMEATGAGHPSYIEEKWAVLLRP